MYTIAPSPGVVAYRARLADPKSDGNESDTQTRQLVHLFQLGQPCVIGLRDEEDIGRAHISVNDGFSLTMEVDQG